MMSRPVLRANILLFTFPSKDKYTVWNRSPLETYTDEGFIHVLMGLFTVWVSGPHHVFTRLSSGWGKDKTINRTLSREGRVWARLKINNEAHRTCAVRERSRCLYRFSVVDRYEDQEFHMLRLGENPCGGILWLEENMKLSYFPQFPQFHERPPGKTQSVDDEFLAPLPIHYRRLVKTVACRSDCAAILDMLAH